MAKKETASQCRRHGFDPWSGKIPHAAKEVSPSATAVEHALGAQEPARLSSHAATSKTGAPERPHYPGEAPARRSPRTQLEGSPAARKTQHSQNK